MVINQTFFTYTKLIRQYRAEVGKNDTQYTVIVAWLQYEVQTLLFTYPMS